MKLFMVNFGMNHFYPLWPVSAKYLHLHLFDKMGWVINKPDTMHLLQCSIFM